MRPLLTIAIKLSAISLPAAAGDKHLTIEDVRTMAFDKGIFIIKEIDLDHGTWKAEGPRAERLQEPNRGGTRQAARS
jgi:hypothetical protein